MWIWAGQVRKILLHKNSIERGGDSSNSLLLLVFMKNDSCGGFLLVKKMV